MAHSKRVLYCAKCRTYEYVNVKVKWAWNDDRRPEEFTVVCFGCGQAIAGRHMEDAARQWIRKNGPDKREI